MKWIEEFRFPENKYRPKIRYWMPHALVSESGIAKDMADLSSRGFGGVEVVTMRGNVTYNVFNRENMWGSKSWIASMKILLREAKKHGLTVDFANGPSWPIADVHATSPDDDSVIRELAYGLRILHAGEHYEGEIPMPEQPDKATEYQKLISLALYKITGENEIDVNTYTPLPIGNYISVTAPGDGDYALFSFFDKPSVLRMNSGLFYCVDHFSKKGTDAIMDVWENELMPEFEEYSDIIECLFCDSLEYIVQLEWTRDFPERFERAKGYSIIPYLPCLGNIMTVGSPDRNKGVFPPTRISGFYLSDRDQFVRVNHDFFDVLNCGYCREHLEYMQKRAEKLGLTVRYQVAYNKNLEAESSALYVGVPENEPLGRPLLDNFRIMSAATHLERKSVYSYECAAESWNGYGQAEEDVLWWIKRSYAGGMNAQVFHGASYCGYYEGEGNNNGMCPGITWPGFTGFDKPRWANEWGRTHDVRSLRGLLDAVTRMNFLLRNTHKVDVAVYRHEYKNNCFIGAHDGGYIYCDDNFLNDAGYTYEFLSPSLMSHPNAKVINGVFDPDGAAYRAIVVNNEEYLDYSGAEKLLEYSHNGLTVIFVGKMPTKCYFASEKHTDAELQEIISRINYIFVQDIHDVPKILEQNDILPAFMPEKNAEIRPVKVDINQAAFYYVYNSHTVWHEKLNESIYPRINKEAFMKPYNGKASFDAVGDVYEIDPFSGKITRIESKVEKNRTIIHLLLERDEAKIIAVLNPDEASMLGIGGEVAEKYSSCEEIILNNWTLNLEYISAPENRCCTYYESVWKKEKEIKLEKLLPWCEIKDDWERKSGVGKYISEFTLENLYKRIIFKPEFVFDSYTVTVNDIVFDNVDPVKHETDITKALKNGTNTIEVTVSSPLMNLVSLEYLRQNSDAVSPQKCGIWGEVKLIVFK